MNRENAGRVAIRRCPVHSLTFGPEVKSTFGKKLDIENVFLQTLNAPNVMVSPFHRVNAV